MSTGAIRVTQAGVSAPLAADYEYVFNSDWPSLAIAFEKNVDVPYLGSVTVPHGLKIYPLTMGWTLLNGVNIGRTFATSGSLSGPQNDVSLTFDNTNVYLTNNGIYNQVTYTISIKCYNIDISKPVDYTLPKQPTQTRVYDPSTGIKVTKYGKSAGSTDLRDYILHSRAQSPAVLSIVTAVNSGKIGYTNPVQYTPWTLAFVGGPGQNTVYSPLAPGSQQAGYIFKLLSAAQATSLGVPQAYIANSFSAMGNFGSLVVLRDPLVVPTTKMVTYG
jgi:hypothetical protein